MAKLKLRHLFLPAVLLLTLPTSAKPGKAPAPKQELQAIYNKINAAIARKDGDGYYDYNSDDYTIIDKKGNVHDASEGRQEMIDALQMVDTIKAVSVIQTFTGTDTAATVSVKEHYIVAAANSVNGRAVRLTFDDVSRDYWTYTEDGWRRMRSRVLTAKGTFHKNF